MQVEAIRIAAELVQVRVGEERGRADDLTMSEWAKAAAAPHPLPS